jgi:hypothetical protein
MSRFLELFELAKNFYAQAHCRVSLDAKRAMQELGEKYLREADILRRDQIVQAAFPRTDAKTESK